MGCFESRTAAPTGAEAGSTQALPPLLTELLRQAIKDPERACIRIVARVDGTA